MEIVSQIIKTDVTAVRILQNLVLAGIGNFLNIFDKNGRFLKRIKIFDSHKIHGIIYKTKLFLYGGCFMQTLTYNLESLEFSKLHKNQIDDWVLTAQFLQNSIGIVTMNNEVIIFNEKLEKLHQVKCKDKCILYSAFIAYEFPELIILSGTVFGEILIWKITETNPEMSSICKKLEGHKGVIFSLDYNPKTGFIASTSDDRSTILWAINQKSLHNELKNPNPTISLTHKFYGHQSRIFRCLLLDEHLVTAGEDSYINIWNYNGDLKNKIATNQGGAIWALDSVNDWLVSGGAACGVLLSFLTNQCVSQRLSLPVVDTPKQVGFMYSGNVIVITDKGFLFYYVGRKWIQVGQFDMKSYVMEISKCRKLVAIAGFYGEIFIYQEVGDNLRFVAESQTETHSRVCSIHWLNCQIFLICDNSGRLSLFYLQNNSIINLRNFSLSTQETDLWTTTACQLENGHIVVGDRRGNLYLFHLTQEFPRKIYRKAHNHLGVTYLENLTGKFLSLGRDGNLKIFNSEKLELLTIDKLPFSWLAKFSGNYLLGFTGKNLIIYDYKRRKILVEIPCGGGHRSWDFTQFSNNLNLVYLKDKVLHFSKWNERQFQSVNITENFHYSTINVMTKIPRRENSHVVISGGEDTTLRISEFSENYFCNLKNLKAHLSSIKTMCLWELNGDVLLVSGGGRGEIIVWKIDGDDCFLQDKFYEENHKKLFQSEIRIMDLKILGDSTSLLLFSANSDGNIKIYRIEKQQEIYKLKFWKTLSYQTKCITKILLIDEFQLLIAMSTDGTYSFWDLHDLPNNLNPTKIIKIHQSGVVSSWSYLTKNKLLIATGGDDNCITLTLFKINKTQINIISQFHDYHHCAQVTGVWITTNYLLTTSIDQKLLIFQWNITNDKLTCELTGRYDSPIADIQGFYCDEDEFSFNVFLYGKGVEFVKINKIKII